MTDSAPRTIAVVRHGETDWNFARRIQGRTEVPLNHTGRAQAEATARLLMAAHIQDEVGGWRHIVSSPLSRALETAQIIARHTGLASPVIEQHLWERDFGPAEGVLVEEAHARWPGLDVPGAEPLEALAKRSATALLRRLDETPGAILVAHGALIRAGLARISGRQMPRILNGEVWLLRTDGKQFAVNRLDS